MIGCRTIALVRASGSAVLATSKRIDMSGQHYLDQTACDPIVKLIVLTTQKLTIAVRSELIDNPADASTPRSFAAPA